MNSDDWLPHVTVGVICERDGRFLMVEESVRGRRVLNQPAGHWENGETLIEAALRETYEETRWQVEIDALVGVYQWCREEPDDTVLRFAFAATATVEDPDAVLDEGIHDAIWISRDELVARADELRSPLVLRCIDDYLAGTRHRLSLLNAL